MEHRAGMFALMKNLTTDRLILDCRPANLLEPGLNQWTQTMGSLVPLLSWHVPPGHKIVAAGEDLKDYYYYYVISPIRSKRNALAMRLTQSEAKRFRGAYRRADKGAKFLVPALATMAMGDLNSVEFGQQAHVRLGLVHGVVKISDLLTLRGRFPRQQWAVGYVIDDFIVVEAVPADLPPSAYFSTSVADEMTAVYARVGLAANDKKRFRAEDSPQFWGISVDGKACLVRAQLDRVLPLCYITARIARAGSASRHLLEVIAGAWTAIIQARKRCMCLLETVFVEIQAHDYGTVFPLTVQLVSELWTLAILAPLYVTDLRTCTSPELYAVDASDAKLAGVVTRLPSEFARELTRHTMTRAAWSRLLSPWKCRQRHLGELHPEEEVPAGEMPAQAHPVWSQLMRSCRFSSLFCKPVPRRQHINISELKSVLQAETLHAVSFPSTRCNIGTDSQVVLGAVVKGRASSHTLNFLLQRHLPTVLSHNLYPGHQYIASAENPADDPTRDRPIRDPEESPPFWLSAAFDGRFDELDAFLKERRADEATLARVPTFVDSHVPDEWLQSERQLRRQVFQQRKHCGIEAVRDLQSVTVQTPSLWSHDMFAELPPEAERALRQLPESYFVFPRHSSIPGVWTFFRVAEASLELLQDTPTAGS